VCNKETSLYPNYTLSHTTPHNNTNMKFHLPMAAAGLAMAGSAYGLDISRVRRDGGGHGHGSHGDHGAHHSAPAAVAAPAASSGYSAPATGYEQPQTGYEEPQTGYGAPQTGYDSPQTGYGATGIGSGYGGGDPAPQSGGFDLTQLLIPILIIAGLALLFPSVTTVAVNRKKREVAEGEEAGGLSNVIERVQDIYMAVLESEECMERVACEVGGLAEDAGLPKTVFHLAESYVPKKYNKFMKKFNTPKDCHKIKCGNFF